MWCRASFERVSFSSMNDITFRRTNPKAFLDISEFCLRSGWIAQVLQTVRDNIIGFVDSGGPRQRSKRADITSAIIKAS